MGLIDLRGSPNAEPVVGWANEGGEIVARAELRRVEGGLELIAVTADDVEDAVAMVDEVVSVASVPTIVTSLRDPWLAERCGFVAGVLHLNPVLADPSLVAAFSLGELQEAIEDSWGPDTSPLFWSEENPARGQCDVTALVVRELLGGSIVCCNVVHQGRRIERHAWNVLATGIAVDLTRRQYNTLDGIAFEAPVEQEPYEIGGLAERAALLSRRARERLGLDIVRQAGGQSNSGWGQPTARS